MATPRGRSVAVDELVIVRGSKPLTSAATAHVICPPGWGVAPDGADVDVAWRLRRLPWALGLGMVVVLPDFLAVVLLVLRAAVVAVPPARVVDVAALWSPATVLVVSPVRVVV